VHLQALAATSGNELSGRLNGQAAAVGHSLGGLTAAKACERDPAFCACANLDGLSYSLPMHVEGETMVATQPFLFLGKPIPRLTDATLKRDHMTRAQDDEIVARMAHRFDALMQSAKAGSYRVILRDADHMDFAGRGNGTIAKAVREYLMAFLDKHVRGIRGTVLDAATSDPAIAVTRYPPRP
jgi:pimeloyl-ACP methyl ester carboxylesterase